MPSRPWWLISLSKQPSCSFLRTSRRKGGHLFAQAEAPRYGRYSRYLSYPIAYYTSHKSSFESHSRRQGGGFRASGKVASQADITLNIFASSPLRAMISIPCGLPLYEEKPRGTLAMG